MVKFVDSVHIDPSSATDRSDTSQRKIRVQIRDFGRSVVEFSWLNLFRKKHRQANDDCHSSRITPLKSSMSWPQSYPKMKTLKDISSCSAVPIDPEESKDWAFIDDEAE